jgi:cobalt/nickel transport system permease protein
MHIIDQYAYANRIRTVDPGQKAALAGLVILLCLLLNQPVVSLLALGWMWGLTTFWAGLPVRTFGRVILAEGFFLILSVIGILVSVSLTPPPPPSWQWQLGTVWVSSSPAAIGTAVQLVTRSLGAAAAMNFLTLTTPLVDLVDLLRRLRCPLLLIDLMTLIYRFIFVLLESLDQMYTAQSSRLGYVNFRRGIISAGLLGSQLFIDAYRRSQRLQVALESRGFTGDLKVLPMTYQFDRRLWGLGTGMIASLLLVWGWL